MIAPHEAQAQKNHYQTLDRLAERGGLSWGEALDVLLDRRDVTPAGLRSREQRIADAINDRAEVKALVKEWEK